MKSAAERRAEIIAFLLTCSWSMTVGEVGKAIGLKRSPYLIGLLMGMVENGDISMETAEHPKYGLTRYFWVERTGETK